MSFSLHHEKSMNKFITLITGILAVYLTIKFQENQGEILIQIFPRILYYYSTLVKARKLTPLFFIFFFFFKNKSNYYALMVRNVRSRES